MGGRKKPSKVLKTGVYIVGEGITEQYYFSHLREHLNCSFFVKPRFFGNTCVNEFSDKIDKILKDSKGIKVLVIAVFDLDVSKRNEKERQELKKMIAKYSKNNNVLLCSSFPSIEYWFLLHFLNTNKHLSTSKEAEKDLKKYISDYEKTSSYLSKTKWFDLLTKGNQLNDAKERAKQNVEKVGSYTELWQVLERI